MALDFPGKRESFVHDIASGDRVVPIKAEISDTDRTLDERDVTRDAIRNAMGIVDSEEAARLQATAESVLYNSEISLEYNESPEEDYA